MKMATTTATTTTTTPTLNTVVAGNCAGDGVAVAVETGVVMGVFTVTVTAVEFTDASTLSFT